MKSMSARLLTNASLLIALVLVIAGFGLYSLAILDDQIVELANISARSNALNRVHAINIERGSIVKDIVMANSEAEFERFSAALLETEAQMREAREAYAAATPASAPLFARETPAQLLQMWEEYTENTNRVVKVAMINSNESALAIAMELDAFLYDFDRRMEAVAVDASTSARPVIRNLAPRLRNVRVAIAQFRNYLYRYATTTDDGRIDQYENQIKTIVAGTNKEIEDIIALLGEENAAVLSAMYAELTGTAAAAFFRMIPIARENSDTRAVELYRSLALPGFLRLKEFLQERLAQTGPTHENFL